MHLSFLNLSEGKLADIELWEGLNCVGGGFLFVLGNNRWKRRGRRNKGYFSFVGTYSILG